MLFNIVVFLLLGVIIYFHYIQGFFSAGLSAIMAAIAAVVAVGFHEVVVGYLPLGEYAAWAHGLALSGTFAAVYIVLRTAFDQYVPGNVRFAVLVDRIGAAAMGLVAGVLALGMAVLSVQTLPFGPSVGGYLRYPVQFDKPISNLQVPERTSLQDGFYDELEDDKFISNEPSKLFPPVDDMVLALVSRVSDTKGSLYSGEPFARVHPDYLQELFGQRLGLQSGSQRIAMPERSEVLGLFVATTLKQRDQERMEVNGNSIGPRGKGAQPPPERLPEELKVPKGRVLLVVRTKFSSSDADKGTSLFSFSPGAVRLVANRKNYFPIGTLEGRDTVYVNTPDDYLFTPGEKAADLVFNVDEEDVLASPEKGDQTIAPGVFLEVKRMSRVDLGGREIQDISKAPRDQPVEVVRKEGVPVQRGGATASGGDSQPQAGGPGPGAKSSPLAVAGDFAKLSGRLPPVSVGTPDRDGRGEQEWGTFRLADRKFAQISMQPVRTLQLMERDQYTVSELAPPPDMKLVQITGNPRQDLPEKWAWAEAINEFQLMDADKNDIIAVGAFAKVRNSGGQVMMVAEYDVDRPVTSVGSSAGMTPTEVTIIFRVSPGTRLAAFKYKGEVVREFSLNVP